MTIVLVALRCVIFPFIATSCCGATFEKDAIDLTSSCALYGKSAVVEVCVCSCLLQHHVFHTYY